MSVAIVERVHTTQQLTGGPLAYQSFIQNTTRKLIRIKRESAKKMFLFMVALTLRGGREEAPPLGGIKNHEKLRGVGGPRVTDQSFTVFFTANMVIKSGVRKIV